MPGVSLPSLSFFDLASSATFLSSTSESTSQRATRRQPGIFKRLLMCPEPRELKPMVATRMSPLAPAARDQAGMERAAPAYSELRSTSRRFSGVGVFMFGSSLERRMRTKKMEAFAQENQESGLRTRLTPRSTP